MFTLKMREIVKSVLLNVDSEAHHLVFRVDIIQDENQKFIAELSEKSTYRMKPRFDVPPDWESDEEIWAAAMIRAEYDTPSDTADECLQKVLQSLNYSFGFQAA